MKFKPFLFILFIFLSAVVLRLAFQFGGVDPFFFKDEQGSAFVQDADSYYYMYLVNNGILSSGLPLLGFYWHKFIGFFVPGVSVMGSLPWLNFFLFGLTILNIFFIAYVLTKSYEAGFFAGLILVLNERFFTGVLNFDTNALIYFLVSGIALFYILIVRHDFKNFRLMNSFWLFLYIDIFLCLFEFFRFSWQGYYFLLFIMASSLFCFGLVYLFLKRYKLATILYIVFGLVVAFVVAFVNWPFKGYIFKGIKESMGYNSISELYSYGWLIFFKIDFPVLLFAVMFFSVYFMVKRKDYAYYFLGVWLFLMIYASSQAFRFVYFAVIPFSILGGVLVWEVYNCLDFKARDIVFLLFFLCLFFVKDYGADREFLVDNSISGLGEVSFPAGSTLVSNWDMGYIVQYFTNRETPYKGSPSYDKGIKPLLVNDNETQFLRDIKGLGEDPYIIWTSHDQKVLEHWYWIPPSSVIYKLINQESYYFEIYYYAETPYNWVSVWRLKDGTDRSL